MYFELKDNIMKILIIGNGFVGSRCAKEWPDAIVSDKMINTVDDALAILNEHNPDVVLNAAGIIGNGNPAVPAIIVYDDSDVAAFRSMLPESFFRVFEQIQQDLTEFVGKP